MAISTYLELKTAVANWLNRSDMTARIPEFIMLAEKDIGRNLRSEIVREALTLTAGTDEKALAATCAELRSVRFDTGADTHSLLIVTPETLATLRRLGSGRPRYVAVVNNTLLFDLAPDSAYALEVIYYKALVALSSDGTTLTQAPADVYLFGALKEAELYLEHDERNPIWTAKYQKAVADENDRRERAELAAGPKSMNLPIILG